jgi:hypothetical protein
MARQSYHRRTAKIFKRWTNPYKYNPVETTCGDGKTLNQTCYLLPAADPLKPHVGHEVSITGTLNQEIVIGISYQTQGIIRIDEN